MSQHVVVRSHRRPDPEAVEVLARVGVATAHEAMGRRGLAHPVLRPIYPGARIAGRAVTVLSQPGDNLMIHACIEQCGPGDVLVVTTTSPSTDGMFGELFATQLAARGVQGLVIDAGVRDVAELTAMGFPAWSRAVSAQGTVKATPGSVNVPVVLAGAVVRPGDVIVADDDGVLVVPREDAPDVAAASLAREAKEQEKREQFQAGVLGLDIYGMRETLARLGVTYVDEPTDEPADRTADSATA
jgi:4-hydroxy-4-methyl-2-oxoglutarate aldolase